MPGDKELMGLMAGGTGGRLGARREDQAALNGWRGIGTLFEQPLGSPRLRSAASLTNTQNSHRPTLVRSTFLKNALVPKVLFQKCIGTQGTVASISLYSHWRFPLKLASGNRHKRL